MAASISFAEDGAHSVAHVVATSDGRRAGNHDGKHPSIVERFFAKVDRSGGPDACWPWTGGRHNGGYGSFAITQNCIVGAHRMMLEIKLGRELKPGEWALHSCDYPPCCNPRHLHVGDLNDNARESVERGRSPKGERNGRHKLSESDVRAIRSGVRAGLSKEGLARRFGVSPSVIYAVAKKLTWRHVKKTTPTPEAQP